MGKRKRVAFSFKVDRNINRGRVPHLPTKAHSSPKGEKGYSRSKEKSKLRRNDYG